MKTTRRKALAMLGMLPATVADAEAHGYRKPRRGTTRPKTTSNLGIIYPFALTSDMQNAILAGWLPNTTYKKRDAFYSNPTGLEANVATAVKDLIDTEHCDALVTLGGVVVHDAVHKYMASLAVAQRVPFFSMGGRWPQTGYGGVDVQTPDKNEDRIRILLGKSLIAREIALYRFKDFAGPDGGTAEKYKVRDRELRLWKTNPAWPSGSQPTEGEKFRIIEHSGNFDEDFNGANFPAATRALVISACPLFLGSLSGAAVTSNIVLAANKWLAAAGSRFVIYPFKEYLPNASNPNVKSFARGPLLTKIAAQGQRPGPLQRLGQQAKSPPAGAPKWDDADEP